MTLRHSSQDVLRYVLSGLGWRYQGQRVAVLGNRTCASSGSEGRVLGSQINRQQMFASFGWTWKWDLISHVSHAVHSENGHALVGNVLYSMYVCIYSMNHELQLACILARVHLSEPDESIPRGLLHFPPPLISLACQLIVCPSTPHSHWFFSSPGCQSQPSSSAVVFKYWPSQSAM